MSIRQDRASISNMHGVPANSRDASNPSPVWKYPATPINTPANKTTSRKEPNPWSGRLKTTMQSSSSHTNKVHKPASNPISRMTLFGHGHVAQSTSKRRKIDNTTPNYTQNIPQNNYVNDMIDLSGEDVGVPVSRASSSSDPIILVPGQIMEDQQGDYSGNASRHIAPDGPATQKLHQRVQRTIASNYERTAVASGEESDPIQSSSEFDPPNNQGKFVKSIVAQFEAAPRHINLAAIPKRTTARVDKASGLKARMKPKLPPSQEHDPLTDSTLRPSKPANYKIFGRNKLQHVMLKTFYKGRQRYADGRYQMTFGDTRSRKITVSKDRNLLLDIELATELESVQISRPESTRFIIVLRILRSSRSTMSKAYTSGAQDSRVIIALEVDTAEERWSRQVASQLGQYFKDAAQDRAAVEYLDSSGSNTCWGHVEQDSNRPVSSPTPPPDAGQQSPLPSETEQSSTSRAQSKSVMSARSAVDPQASTSHMELRRSSRISTSAAHTSTRNSPPEDSDELILVYPPTGPGAINITRGDLNRLQPGQYLNDTLIEFGLKLWLNRLREENPELAEQIHVFSSFFYKKLNTKNKEEGYKSVRKWTQRFDIFKKKYIIVPINEHLHWYLAIIYQPEHILFPSPLNTKPRTVLARKRKRESDVSFATNDAPQELSAAADQSKMGPIDQEALADESSTQIVSDSCSPSPTEHTDTLKHEQDEKEVEDIVNEDFVESIERSCSISGAFDSPSRRESAEDSEPLLGHVLEQRHLTPMDVDQDNTLEFADSATNTTAEDVVEVDIRPIASTAISSVNSTDFYRSRTTQGKQRAAPAPFPSLEIEPDSEREDPEVDVPEDDKARRTWIITFDSLGGSHPAAIKNLQTYLRFEALDKKSVTNVGEAKPGKALVPIQNNYCDCGVYLVHFVQTYMKNPEGFNADIRARKKRTPKQRMEDWDGERVKLLRQDLTQQISELQEVWKKHKLANGETKGGAMEKSDPEVDDDDDDDEIIIEEIRPAPGKLTIKKPKPKLSSAAERPRG